MTKNLFMIQCNCLGGRGRNRTQLIGEFKMKKIKTVFKMDYDLGKITKNINQEVSWLFDNDAENFVIPTVKIDGASTMVKDGVLYKRYDMKPRKISFKERNRRLNSGEPKFTWNDFKAIPENSITCQDSFDEVTGHFPIWIPVNDSINDSKYHIEAFNLKDSWSDGTYELIGKKVCLNKYGLENHELVKHGSIKADLKAPFTLENIYEWLMNNNEEGLVFHNTKTGDYAKVRRSDFAIDQSYFFNWKDAKLDEFYKLNEV